MWRFFLVREVRYLFVSRRLTNKIMYLYFGIWSRGIGPETSVPSHREELGTWSRSIGPEPSGGTCYLVPKHRSRAIGRNLVFGPEASVPSHREELGIWSRSIGPEPSGGTWYLVPKHRDWNLLFGTCYLVPKHRDWNLLFGTCYLVPKHRDWNLLFGPEASGLLFGTCYLESYACGGRGLKFFLRKNFFFVGRDPELDCPSFEPCGRDLPP
jgi:hypothetical protein